MGQQEDLTVDAFSVLSCHEAKAPLALALYFCNARVSLTPQKCHIKWHYLNAGG